MRFLISLAIACAVCVAGAAKAADQAKPDQAKPDQVKPD